MKVLGVFDECKSDRLQVAIRERLMRMGFDSTKSERASTLIAKAIKTDVEGSTHRALESIFRYEGISFSQLNLPEILARQVGTKPAVNNLVYLRRKDS